MKRWLLVCVVALAYGLAWGSAASAAETIGLLILGAELGGTAILGGITAATIVGTVVVTAASIGISYATNALFGPKPAAFAGTPGIASSPLPPPEAGHVPLRQPIPPRIVGYGRNRLAGAYVFYEVDDADSHDISALHHGRLQAIVGYYLHDDVIEITSNVVQEMSDGRYGESLITIETRLGLDTETAYGDIVSALPTLWTTAHRGDGLASLRLSCGGTTIADYTTRYPRGKPEPSVVADCSLLYDWRDQAQSQSDSSTWTSSTNPVIQIIDQLTNADRGMGLDFNTVILPNIDDWAEQADICDTLFLKKSGGYEPRYSSSGTFRLDTDPADIIEAILATCDGMLFENGDGTFKIVVGSYVAPQITIEAKHVRGIAPRFGVPDEQLVNEIVPSYTEPQADYKTVPGQPFRDEASIAVLGKVRSQPLSLPWVQSHSQARRLAKRRMRRINAAIAGTLRTTLYGIRALGERWITLQYPDIEDLADVVIEIVTPPRVDLASATVTFEFVVIDPDGVDAWDPDSEEGDPPALPEKDVVATIPVPANLAAQATLYSVGGDEFQGGFEIQFDNPVRPELAYQLAYKLHAASTYTEGVNYTGPIIDNVYHISTGGIFVEGFSGQSYDLKIRSISPGGGVSAYSSPVTVTFP